MNCLNTFVYQTQSRGPIVIQTNRRIGQYVNSIDMEEPLVINSAIQFALQISKHETKCGSFNSI